MLAFAGLRDALAGWALCALARRDEGGRSRHDHARDMYLPSRVSTRIVSPLVINSGT